MSAATLSARELQEQLARYLDSVLSSRRTAEGPARSLAQLTRQDQEFVLHWVGIAVKTSQELGYQFAEHATAALKLMDRQQVERWLVRAMDTYDRQGLYPACAALQDAEGYARRLAGGAAEVAFDDVAGVLQKFTVGLSGRDLKLAASECAYTDTRVLYVPERIGVFSSKERNFGLYKAIIVYLWAQVRFGTFGGRAGVPRPSQVLGGFDDHDKAGSIFEALEAVRLNANIAGELACMHRQMMALQEMTGPVNYPATWGPAVSRLSRLPNSVGDTYQALRGLYQAGSRIPPPFCFQGEFRVADAESGDFERRADEKTRFQSALAENGINIAGSRDGEITRPDIRMRPVLEAGRAVDFQLSVGEVSVPISPQTLALARSIFQDFGEIPGEYLVASGDGGLRRDGPRQGRQKVWMGTYYEHGVFVYDEWDCRRRHYRKDWCFLRELDIHPADTRFVDATLEKYSHLIAAMRKSFEALRGENKLLRRQSEGGEIDIDAVVEAFADSTAGMEMSDRLFMRSHKMERDMAVVFMVDMSGSTKGWINEAEREALVLLCESLQVLGDRYAIYGFSGMTRKRCELYKVKSFEEAYDERVKRRISGIRPQDYTRMGVAIRHLNRRLGEVDARTKLLITLSDGKPDDYDGYRGEYGIEDTRQALIEARNQGIHPFCITIDTEARAYLPHMYGAVNYVVIDEVAKLPLKVSDIYRRITA